MEIFSFSDLSIKVFVIVIKINAREMAKTEIITVYFMDRIIHQLEMMLPFQDEEVDRIKIYFTYLYINKYYLALFPV